jgi:hypothetical protein
LGDGRNGLVPIGGRDQVLEHAEALASCGIVCGPGWDTLDTSEWLDELDPGLGERGLLEWMRALAERVRRVRVCCDDWTSVCGGKSARRVCTCRTS